MGASWLDELNPAQRRAVTWGDGPLLVIAGAGTGKTRTLACRVAWLIEQGVRPERILLLTFTRRAADEMLRRAEAVVQSARSADQPHGAPLSGKVWGGTFHAVANRLLRQFGRPLGLSADFTVMDAEDAADMLGLIRAELGFARTAERERRFAQKQTLAAIYSRVVNAQQKLAEILERHFPWCRDDRAGIAQIFDAYAQRKRERQVLDYDDLLLYWKALCDLPGVGERVAGLFDHILVDEYQDTNAVQADILRGMRRTNRNVMVVGDDAQSIYSFRAATVRNILDFPEQFPGAGVVTLEQNYRSVRPILDASNAVMEFAARRYTKNLWSQRPGRQRPVLYTCRDEEEQTRRVCENVLQHLEQGVPLRRQAVLFRTGHHSAMLEVELTSRKIPFHKYGGLRFIEAAHVKDLLALLRIVENPYDEISWFRALRLIEGVGPRTTQKVMEELGVRGPPRPARSARRASSSSGVGAPEAAAQESPLLRLARRPPALPPAAAEPFESLRCALLECCGLRPPAPARRPRRTRPADGSRPPRSSGRSNEAPATDVERVAEPPLPAQIERLRECYEPLCRRAYDNAVVRLRDLEQLANIAGRYRSRGRFIADLTLDPPTATSDLAGPPFLEEDYLVLSTIHSAKGCEWTVVHIIHAADGMIPSDMAISDADGVEEERRLLYVAMTRARDWLYIYFPLRYYHRRFGVSDRHGFAQLTRFIPPAIRGRFEQRADATEIEFVPDGDQTDDVQHRLGALWRD